MANYKEVRFKSHYNEDSCAWFVQEAFMCQNETVADSYSEQLKGLRKSCSNEEA